MLDTRLTMIFDLLPQGILCDIGTDHCKLAVHAVESLRAPFSFATDLRKGPLSAADRLIKKHGLENKITTMLSNGFLDIPKEVFESVDCFVIAGMGGELIANIIKGRPTDKYMVLQPMTAINELIEFLAKNGYAVKKRKFCRDGEKIYTAMLVKYDGVKREPDLYFASERDDLFYDYLNRERNRVTKVIAALNGSEKADKSRIPELEGLLGIIESELKK